MMYGYGGGYGSAQAAPSQTQAVTSPTSATMPVHAPIVRSRRAEPAGLAVLYLLGIAAIVYATR
jgi:hypothetical protein